MVLLAPAPPVDAEVRLGRAVRAFVDVLRLRLCVRLEDAAQRVDVVHEAELGLDLREDVPEEGVRGGVGEEGEEGGVEDGLEECEDLGARGWVCQSL